MSDLIKREDAIRAVAEVLSLNRFASFKNIKDFGRFAERMLRNVPSADRPQGEWITKYNGNGWNDYWDYTCTNCKMKFPRADNVLYRSSYCPHCGARMKGAE